MVIRRIVVLALIIAAAGVASAPAGETKRYAVDVSIRQDLTPRSASARGKILYKGKLRSEKRACENSRVVTLWRITEGETDKQSQGTYETGGNGKWAIISYVNTDGEYFATTPKITLSGSGKTCKRGRSKSIFRDVQP